ncbi:hypothetical protein [Chromobacterium paludis]|uniref:Uncharacterized protein n=1 Tax=Chromobacterium paludis TaxID=2605945 RepID=A0A5C1DFZ7_9NEIS|nr:hypothetical protein [Chromobacterium paludis]QEL55473.1 hypothetical protein FYK34_07800 [Chromobacterium paludis]
MGSPPGCSFSAVHLFTAALLGAQRHFSALMKGLGLRHRWRIYDNAGNSISLQDFDAKLAEAKALKEPLTLKRLGIQTVSIEG